MTQPAATDQAPFSLFISDYAIDQAYSNSPRSLVDAKVTRDEMRKLLQAALEYVLDTTPINRAELRARGLSDNAQWLVSEIFGERLPQRALDNIPASDLAIFGYGPLCPCGERGMRPGEEEIDGSCSQCADAFGEQSVATTAVEPSRESADLNEHRGNDIEPHPAGADLRADSPVLPVGGERRPAARPVTAGWLTIGDLQEAHQLRQEECCPEQKPDLSFRGNEMAGEVGEACNVIKKLERERHGWRGSRATLDNLGDELADVIHTAILCAITAGIDLEPRVAAKFNATSDKNGLSVRLDEVKP